MEAEDIPYTIEHIDDPTWPRPMIRANGWVLPAQYKRFAKKILEFPLLKEQVWVIGFPRSGTTMMQELVWLIQHNVDLEAAKKPCQQRTLFLDSCFVRSTAMPGDQELNDPLKTVIKTHLAFDLLPPELLETCKIVFIVRNPMDIAVSLFHFHPLADNITTEWDHFINNKGMYSPFWPYILQGWSKRNEPNVLFLFYEDTQHDMRDTILKLAEHLNKHLSEEQINALENYMNIKNFRENKAVNHHFLKDMGEIKYDFIRKGGIGGWRNYFTEEMKEKANKWMKTSTEGTGFAFREY